MKSAEGQGRFEQEIEDTGSFILSNVKPRDMSQQDNRIMLNSGNSYRTFVKTKSKSKFAQKINRNTSQISNTSEVSGYLADFRLQNFENFK